MKPPVTEDSADADPMLIVDGFSSQAEPLPHGILDQFQLIRLQGSELSSEFRFCCRDWVLHIEDTMIQERHIYRDLESRPSGTRRVRDHRRQAARSVSSGLMLKTTQGRCLAT